MKRGNEGLPWPEKGPWDSSVKGSYEGPWHYYLDIPSQIYFCLNYANIFNKTSCFSLICLDNPEHEVLLDFKDIEHSLDLKPARC